MALSLGSMRDEDLRHEPDPVELRRKKNRERVARWRARKRAERALAGSSEAGGRPIRPENIELIERYLSFRTHGAVTEAGRPLLRDSREAYRSDLLAFAAFLGDRSLLAVDRNEIVAWFEQNTREPKRPDDPRPWSRRTAHRKRSALAGFYRWALDEGLLSTNPMQHIRPPRFDRKYPERIAKPWIDRLFQHIEDRIAVTDGEQAMLYIMDALILRLLFNWGLRVSEATNITYDQIRRVDGELRIQIVRKGDRVLSFVVGGKVEAAFRRWHQVRQNIPAKVGHADYLFVHPRLRRRVSRKRAWLRIRRLAQEAGLPASLVRSLSPHKLRHAIAFYHLEHGMPLNRVQALLGHASIASTQVYVEAGERERLDTIRSSNEV